MFDIAKRALRINNGAAECRTSGIPVWVISRLATVPVTRTLTPQPYGADIAGVYVDAMAVHFDARAWDDEFTRLWPLARLRTRHIIDASSMVRFFIDDALGRAPLLACEPALA